MITSFLQVQAAAAVHSGVAARVFSCVSDCASHITRAADDNRLSRTSFSSIISSITAASSYPQGPFVFCIQTLHIALITHVLVRLQQDMRIGWLHTGRINCPNTECASRDQSKNGHDTRAAALCSAPAHTRRCCV